MTFVCPLTDIRIGEPCVVITCLHWSRHVLVTNCAYGTELSDDTQVVILKDLKNVRALSERRKAGEQEIFRMLILDKYYHYLVDKYGNSGGEELYFPYPFDFPKHRWTTRLHKKAVSAKVYSKFLKRYDGQKLTLQQLLAPRGEI